MGTYTTNYNLFMPTVGETGWGTLVNGNFTTIDTTMKSLSNRITAVENEVNGALSCTSVTTTGTITSSGKITANGGLSATTGTFSGAVTAASFKPSSYVTYTVTPITSTDTTAKLDGSTVVLPPVPGVRYTGSVNIYNSAVGTNGIGYRTTTNQTTWNTISVAKSSTGTISFTNAQMLVISPQNYACVYPVFTIT